VNRDRAAIGVFFNLTAVDNSSMGKATDRKRRNSNTGHFQTHDYLSHPELLKFE
jgi:hypothetical protein